MPNVRREQARGHAAAGGGLTVSGPAKVSEHVQRAAEQHGLGKALKLAPEIVAAAAERGAHPLSKPAAPLSPLTSPAPVFDPASFGKK